MHVVILINSLAENPSPDDQDTVVQAEAVSAALLRMQHRVTQFSTSLDLSQLENFLRETCPDVIFNLVESLGGSDRLTAVVPQVLEVLGYSFTGCSSESLYVTTNKVLAKERMRAAQLPTADWWLPSPVPARAARTLNHGEPTRRQGTSTGEVTAIIKPTSEHASVGMHDDCVVTVANEGELVRLLSERARDSTTPLFAERFIAGREFNVSLLAGPSGPIVLPPAEIDFSRYPAGKPRVVGYKAKWDPESFEFSNTPRRFDFSAEDQRLLDQIEAIATACWSLFDLRGYARVDFRVDEAGAPWVLEINSNPCLAPDAGFAAALSRGNISFDEAIARIVADARGLA